MNTKPILRAVPTPLDVQDKCNLCACAGKCLDKDYRPLTPIFCFMNGSSLYFQEVVREPIRN